MQLTALSELPAGAQSTNKLSCVCVEVCICTRLYVYTSFPHGNNGK